MRHIRKKEKTEDDTRKNVKRELRVTVSAEYALWINKEKKWEKKKECFNDQ
jgi:hypothetical protein